MIRLSACAFVALALSLPLALGACGKKGDPKRPVPEGTATPADRTGQTGQQPAVSPAKAQKKTD